MANKQPNTFVNSHLPNDENPTKINAFEIALDNQKQQWKSKDQKTSFKKMLTNNFPETKEQMVTKMISLSKQKGHRNKMNTKIESNLPTLPKQSSQDS